MDNEIKARFLLDGERRGLNAYVIVAVECVNIDLPHPGRRGRGDRKCLSAGLFERRIGKRGAPVDVSAEPDLCPNILDSEKTEHYAPQPRCRRPHRRAIRSKRERRTTDALAR